MPARPFRQFVLKVHSRCDLACDHCYVYRHADQSWQRRPRVMTPHVVRAAARRIAEHASAHRLGRVTVVLHGGEPLLAGPERLAAIAHELRERLDGVAVLDLRMQTNGLLLDEAFCATLVRERIRTGVSLDGDRTAHDRHRVRADGSGSYDDVVRAVRLLGRPENRAAFAGLLCTVDVANDPTAVYDALAETRPPRVDFLLPHATWDRPPARPRGGADYGDWLISVYERWTADGRPFSVRLFESVEASAEGEAGFTEALGLGSPDLAVIETDGAIEQADWLKTVAEGAPETGFHVLTHTFDEAAAHPGFQARALGLEGLAAACRRCPVVEICGGGLYGHRYRTGGGFANPSVYCADLLRSIRHIQRAGAASTASSRRTLSRDELTALVSGGTREHRAVLRLGESQLNLRRAMLAYLHRSGAGRPETWQALFELDGPELDAVLADSATHLRAVAACSACARGREAPSADFLDGLALAAAVRAGRRLRLEAGVGPSGVVSLPTVGRLLTGPTPSAGGSRLVLVADGDGVRRADGGEAAWQPVRCLTVEGVELRLSQGDREQSVAWQRSLGAAWAVLNRRHPLESSALAAGVHSLVALASEPDEDAPRPAFGTLALSPTACDEDLALALMREWQYAKFAALRDMYGLRGPGQDTLRRAYVRLAVARAWQARPDRASRGTAALWQARTLSALDAFAAAGSPAETGVRLAAAIRAAVSALATGA